MNRITTVLVAVAAALVSAGSLLANNLFVLPTFTGSATGNALIYRGSPLQQVATVSVPADAFTVLSRATTAAGDVKYYVVARSGGNSMSILNANFQLIGQPISLGQTVTAAAATPDGRRILVLAGNLRQYSTATDQEIQAQQFIDVGPNPQDMVVSADSRRAFVLSSQGQSLTAVDLENNRVAGRLPLANLLPGQGFIAMGPHGMLYVSAGSRVLEVDPRATPFENSVRRQFTMQGANVGRLYFTPDGTRALAVNQSPQNGQLLYLFQLDYVTGGFAALTNADAALTAFAFEKVFVASNELAYVTTATTSANPRRLYAVTIPGVVASAAQLQPPTVQEAFFGSLGTIPIVDSVAFSQEQPQPDRMFISAPLNLLTTAAQNTVYAATFGVPNPNVTNQFPLTFLPGPLAYAGPAVTNVEEAPGGLVRYGALQPALAAGGRTLPFGVKVLSSSRRPLFNVPVTFSTITQGATIEGLSTVFTNADGVAMTSAVAPTTPGDFTINVAIGGSGLTTSFTYTVAASGGGGGGGGGGETGVGGLIVIEGDGQVIREGDFSPLRVRVRVVDAAGKGIPDTPVTWSVTQGGGRWNEGVMSPEGPEKLITTTDACPAGQAASDTCGGFTSNVFIGPSTVGIGNSYSQSIVTATAAGSTATMYMTTILAISGGALAPYPSANLLAPTREPYLIEGKAGQTVNGAIQMQFVISTGPQLGAVIPNVGLHPSTGNDPKSGPTVECVPRRIALSNEQGIATCDLKLGGKSGTSYVRVNAGGFTERLISVRVDPGDPTVLTVRGGDNQGGDINAQLPAQLVVEVGDGGGNTLAGANVRWEVIQGTATLGNSLTLTDAQGRAFNTVRLGTQPGLVLVRATAVGGTQPSVTFTLRVNVTVASLAKTGGDNQTTFTNSAFANPLVVEVKDSRNQPVPGQNVTFTVVSGSATLSAATVPTGQDGRAQVTVRAGANAGPIQIRATVQSLAGQEVLFALTAQLPGPQINALDFFNAASGERGAVVPGGLYTMVGVGLAPDLRGCIEGATQIGPWPLRLSNVEVQFGSQLAPLLNVCNLSGRESVTFQAPFELAPGGQVSVTVRVGGGSSVVNGVQVVDLQPGVFETVDALGRRYAVALRPDGTFVTPENQARYGEIIRCFITGAGAVTPAAQTGAVGVRNQNVVAPVTVGINDSGVRLVSATYAAGMIGVYEVAFEVPQGTATGPSRPLGVLLSRPNGQFVYPGNAPVIPIAP